MNKVTKLYHRERGDRHVKRDGFPGDIWFGPLGEGDILVAATGSANKRDCTSVLGTPHLVEEHCASWIITDVSTTLALMDKLGALESWEKSNE